jgi:outer membrane receptor protein involved in Fe transport
VSRARPARRRGAVAVAAPTLLIAALGGSVEVRAQAGEASPQRVEVVGQSPLAGTARPMSTVPGHVQAADAAELARSQALDLAEFMGRRFGSVQLNELQGNPLQPDLSFRGFTASPLLGTPQGLAVVIDGVRLNQPFGDVVSWDLIPTRAIAQATLLPGAQPVFGLNALGGALVLTTLDGRSAPGGELALQAGSYGRKVAGFTLGRELGAIAGSSADVFATGQWFDEGGWRDASPSRQTQLFVKLGAGAGRRRFGLALAAADSDLTGNGMQEQRWLDQRWASVFTRPDTTRNRSTLLNLTGNDALAPAVEVSGNLFVRRIDTRSLNGDVNADSLDQDLYFDPTPANLAKLAGAGYRGMPTTPETAANTPFPYWNCLLETVDNAEPNQKCTGLLNRSATQQSSWGLGLQASASSDFGGLRHQLSVGIALERARADFQQSSEFGTIGPDHGVGGVGVFADGTQQSENAFDARVDLATRIDTDSLYATDAIALTPAATLSLGLRWNHHKIALHDRLNPVPGPGSLEGEHAYRRVDPVAGLVVQLSPSVSAHLAIGDASRAPTAVELGCADPADPCRLPNAMAGDPPLKQVVARTVEAGLRGTIDRLRWHAGVFRADNRDDIVFVAADVAGSGYFRNVDRTRRQGLEIGAEATAGRLTAGAELSLLDATFGSRETLPGAANSSNSIAQGMPPMPGLDGGTITVQPGDRLPLQPRQLLKLRADWRLLDGLTVGADASIQSDQIARGNENGRHQPDGVIYLGSGRSAGYGVVNATAAWEAGGGWTLTAKLSNLFDRRYTTGAVLAATPFSAASSVDARQVGSYLVDGNRQYAVRQTTLLAPGAPRRLQIGALWRF